LRKSYGVGRFDDSTTLRLSHYYLRSHPDTQFKTDAPTSLFLHFFSAHIIHVKAIVAKAMELYGLSPVDIPERR
jgi:hypothetical protein